MISAPLIMKLPDWPAGDRSAWFALFAGGGILDDVGRGVHWSAGTRRKFAQSYGHWLGYLYRTGQFDPGRRPAERFTPEALRAFGEDTLERVSPISTSSQIVDLYLIARALDPEANW